MVDVDDYGLKMINSNVHCLNYAYKVISVVFMFLFVILADSAMDMFMINLFLFVIMIWSNISVRLMLKNISTYSVFLFLFFFLVSLFFLDIYIGMMWTVKIIDIMVYLSVVGMTTSFYDLVRGARYLFRPISFLGDINKLAIKLGVFLKFMTVMYSERKRIDGSKILRGVNIDNMKFIDRIDNLLNEFFVVIRYSVFKFDKLKSNIYVNKYGVDSLKYNYRLNKWGKTDTILLIINVLMMFIVLVY